MCSRLQEMIIGDLRAETVYSVSVAAYSTKGDGVHSKARLVTTLGMGEHVFIYIYLYMYTGGMGEHILYMQSVHFNLELQHLK